MRAPAEARARSRWIDVRVAAVAAVSLAVFAVYLRTAARTITWANGGADGAELSAAAYVLGVAHPPGYPLYLLVGHLFALLPIGEVAFRVTLLSVVSGALAAGVAAAIAAALTDATDFRAALAGVGAGLGLALAPLYWSQATIAEVYALHGLFVLLGIAALVAWRPGRDRVLVALALILGLGLGNHLSLALLAVAAVPFILLADRRLWCRPVAVLAVAAFLLGIGVYLYLPVRAAADPAINWGAPRDAGAFLAHVTGAQYQGYAGLRPPEEVVGRASAIAGILAAQLTWPGLLVALLGLSELAVRRPMLTRALLVYVALTLVFALVYHAEGGQVYLLPVVIVLSLGVGVGLAHLARTPQRALIGAAALVGLAAWQLGTNWTALDISGDQTAASYARDTLANAAPGGVLHTERDEQTFALWYGQIVEGLRPDVAVVDQRLLRYEWYRAQLGQRHLGLLQSVAP
jgi:hypothetical protein